MHFASLTVLALSAIAPFSAAVPAASGLRTIYTSSTSLGDLAIRQDGLVLATSPENPNVFVIDPDNGSQKIGPVVFPSVQSTFGIVKTSTDNPDTYFVVGGNITKGVPVEGSFVLFTLSLTNLENSDIYPQVSAVATFPSQANQPTSSIVSYGDYTYIVDIGAQDVIVYEGQPNQFYFNLFNPNNAVLKNPKTCENGVGVVGLALSTSSSLDLWFSNQGQAVTGNAQIDYYNGPTSDFVVKTRQAAVGSGCSEPGWGRITVDQDEAQWITTSDRRILKAGTDGKIVTAVSGLAERPVAVNFGRTDEYKTSLFVVTEKGESGGSLIQVFDTVNSTANPGY